MTSAIYLTIATGDLVHERMRPWIEGRVRLEGCEVRFRTLVAGEMLVRSFEDAEFNVSELSLSNYITRREHGDCPYLAIPVFIARSFRHSDFYIRTDRGIKTPQDLRGRRVGTAEYQHTAHVWERAILEQDYGVKPAELKWVQGHKEKPYVPADDDHAPPPGLSITPAAPGKSLSQLLESGEIDALFSPQAPSCFLRNAANVGRLFPDVEAVEDDYFRRTGIFPVLHIMGLRNELAARYPDLPARLFRAFNESKNIALAAMHASPSAETKRMRTLMGDDFCAYGIGEPERNTLELFLRYHFEQGLSQRRHDWKDLFSPVAIGEFAT